MSTTIEKLQAINSFIRTMLALVIVGTLGTAGWYGYETYYKADQDLQLAQQELKERGAELERSRATIESQRVELSEKDQQLETKQATIVAQQGEIQELNVDIEKKKEEIAHLARSLRLHKMQRRLARLYVKDVIVDPETEKTYSLVEFVELNGQGDPIGTPREFRLEGDKIYVDYWVVKFEDKYVEKEDLDRGTSICLFRRIFGEYQKPSEGFAIDEPGTQPGNYARGGVVSELEKRIWDDFWSIANSPEKATEMGIRTLHGDAVSIRMTKGKTYRVIVRASSGPEIEVDEASATPAVSGVLSWEPNRQYWPSWSPSRRPSPFRMVRYSTRGPASQDE